MKLKILSIQHHRNGVHGNSFYAVTFTEGRGKSKGRKVGLVFRERGNCAILDIDLLNAGNITFGQNSWRYEDYADDLREAIVQMWAVNWVDMTKAEIYAECFGEAVA